MPVGATLGRQRTRPLHVGYRAVLSTSLGRKQMRLVYGRGHGEASTKLPTRKTDRERYCLADGESCS